MKATASMRDQSFNPVDEGPRPQEWTVALALALAILICLGAFVWLFVLLDPFMSDFISGTEPVNPAAEEAPSTTSP